MHNEGRRLARGRLAISGWGQVEFVDLSPARAFVPREKRQFGDGMMPLIQGRADAGGKEIMIPVRDGQDPAVVEWQFSDVWIKTYGPLALGDPVHVDDAMKSAM